MKTIDHLFAVSMRNCCAIQCFMEYQLNLRLDLQVIFYRINKLFQSTII